jgi:uncharacterized repeat protein (TIGR04076 family)
MITATHVEGLRSRTKKGSVFYVRNARLEIPMGQSVCLFALGSLLQPITAASVPTTTDNDILAITQEFQCPDPLAKVIFRIEEIAPRAKTRRTTRKKDNHEKR